MQLLYDDDAEDERELDEQVLCPSCHLPTVVSGDERWCQWEHILVAQEVEWYPMPEDERFRVYVR